MRINRFFTKNSLKTGREIRIGGKLPHYLRRVLRLSQGDGVVLFNGDGHDYQGHILRLGEKQVTLSLEGKEAVDTESALNITLAQAISRGERMDYSLQKSTELGVTAIQPLFTQRVEVKLQGERLARRMRHWQGVITAACEQSGRCRLPSLAQPMSLGEWLGERQSMDENQACSDPAFVLQPAVPTSLVTALEGHSSVTVLTGPEGGFSSDEIRALEQTSIVPVTLGPRVLRTETAGPAAIACLQAIAGDFR